MTKASITRVGSVMSRSPHCVGVEETLLRAAEVMRTYGIRHLPVLENGRPVGMLNERDIVLAETLSGGSLARVTVAEAMTSIPYCATPDTPVAEVAGHLSRRKLDSALVMSGSRVLGVFTTTDALTLLSELLSEVERDAHDGELPPLKDATGS